MIRARSLTPAIAILGFVRPEAKGAVGDGSTDDTAAFTAALADGRPLLLDWRKTYCLNGLTIGSSDNCPGIFSLGGRATIKPASTATALSNLITIRKSDFRVDNIFFDMPISTTDGTPPAAAQLALYFLPSGSISRVWVTNCRFRGGVSHCTFQGVFNNIYVTDNLFESSWADAVDAYEIHSGTFTGNQFYSCCWNNTNGGGLSAAAAPLRLSSSSQASAAELLTAVGNTFKDCCQGIPQEALDISGAAAKNVLVVGNNCSGTQNGFLEAKCGSAGASGGDSFYHRWIIASNQVQLVAGTNSIGIDLHLSTSGVAADKAGQVLIVGNHIACDAMPGSADGTQGVIVEGWSDVAIIGNQMLNLGAGIRLDGSNVTGTTISRIQVVANSIYVYSGAVASAANTINDLVLLGNRLRAVVRAISFAAGTLNNLVMASNFIVSDTEYGMEMRNVVTGTIFGNIFQTYNSCILTQGTAPGTVYIENNRLAVSSANHALNLGTGTAIYVIDNRVDVPSTHRTVTGAATYFAAGNIRGAVNADPSATYAAAVGDVFKNYAPTSGGASYWTCTTAGSAGAATYKATVIA